MKSITGQCEICGKESLTIIDGRVKKGPFGPKGHFVFMCPPCHWTQGMGYLYEDMTVYQRFGGRYFELKGNYWMTPEEIRDGVNLFIKEVVGYNDQVKVALIGEIAIQISIQNEIIKVNNDLLRRLLDSKPVELPEIKPIKVDEGLTAIDGEFDGN